MASTSLPSVIRVVTVPIIIIILLSHYLEAAAAAAVGGAGLLGGRTKLKNLNTNKEIQELGRYAVHCYNKHKEIYIKNKDNSSGAGDLWFREVVEAEKQVVSGIKYYMKIATLTQYGSTKTFDAVLVVTPWKHHHSKQLLKFTPSSPATTTTTK